MSMISLDAAGERHPTRPFVMALATRVLRVFERRRAIHELTLLDDHMLNDIGIARYEIRRAVDGSGR